LLKNDDSFIIIDAINPNVIEKKENQYTIESGDIPEKKIEKKSEINQLIPNVLIK